MPLLRTRLHDGRDGAARELIAGPPALNRNALSKEFCRRIGWYKPDGGLKDMMAKVTMLAMFVGLLNNPGLGSGWYGGSRGGGERVRAAHKVAMCAHSAFPGGTGPPEGE